MTLQELKNQNPAFSTFKDKELIKIFNEISKVEPQIDSMKYEISEESMIDKVKFSPQVINFIVDKKLSNNNLSQEKKLESVLLELKKLSEELNKKQGLEEEKKYINQTIEKLSQEQIFQQNLSSFIEKYKGLIISEPDMSKLTQEQIAFMILFQPEKMRDYNISIEPIIQNENTNDETTNISVDTAYNPSATQDPGPFPMPEPPVQSEIKEKIIKNSLQDLKNKKIVPQNITDEQLIIFVCNMFNLDPSKVDMSYVLSEQNINLLKSSSLISTSELKADVKQEQLKSNDKFKELIDNYQAMLDGMKDNPQFEEDAKSLTELIDRLKTEQQNNSEELNNIDKEGLQAVFDYGSKDLSGIQKGFSDLSKAIVMGQESTLENIDQEYAKLAAQKERLESVKPQFARTKIKNNINIALLSSRMDKLRKKQGKIQTNQKRIIAANSQMYISKQEKQFKKYMKEQEKINYETQRKQNKVDELNFKQNKVNDIERKISSLEEKKMHSNELQKIAINSKQTRLENRKERVERAMKRLEGKIGKMNLSEQYQTMFNQSTAMAM